VWGECIGHVAFMTREAEVLREIHTFVAGPVWSVAYACFLLYPTIAPRPDTVPGDGFAVWGLQFLYDADPPYNCFPSIHVAHWFVSALACHRVHRTLGFVAVSFASLVAIATLLTKQHYSADVIGGKFLAVVANAVKTFSRCDRFIASGSRSATRSMVDENRFSDLKPSSSGTRPADPPPQPGLRGPRDPAAISLKNVLKSAGKAPHSKEPR
jgi:hypothetical protein